MFAIFPVENKSRKVAHLIFTNGTFFVWNFCSEVSLFSVFYFTFGAYALTASDSSLLMLYLNGGFFALTAQFRDFVYFLFIGLQLLIFFFISATVRNKTANEHL